MDCGVASNYSTANSAASQNAAASPNGVRTERSPSKTGLHVNFCEKGEVKERREKFLTAKYGSHQMTLIRKRLAVEMWLYDELQKLYDKPLDSVESADVEVDIDELLDMDSCEERRNHLLKLLVTCNKSSHEIDNFIEELLAKIKTL